VKKDLKEIERLKKQIQETRLDLMTEDGTPEMQRALQRKLERLEEKLDKLAG